MTCDVIAGCDGFHGICRPLVPGLSVYERSYPYAWLGILADAAPSTDELIYSRHESGFALYSMRSPEVSRLYLQVPAEEALEAWSDDRIWAELQKRFALPGWSVSEGRITDKSITPMRSFVAGPMRHGRLFLAGDAAHIVPPCGAKGLNLAVGDAIVLASALSALLLEGSPALADDYSDACLRRVWRATHFSYFMTSMMHVLPDDPFDDAIQHAQLRYVTTSKAAATSLAENYSGYESPRFGGLLVFLPPRGRSARASRADSAAATPVPERVSSPGAPSGSSRRNAVSRCPIVATSYRMAVTRLPPDRDVQPSVPCSRMSRSISSS